MGVAAGKPAGVHPLRRPDGQRRLLGVGEVHRPKLAAEKSGCREGLQFLILAHSLQPLADVDEGRHHLLPGAEHPAHPGADVRAGNRLRRHIAGVPVVLMPRVENAPQIGLHMGADQRAPVEHGGDLFEPLTNLHPIDRGGDRREGADHIGHCQPGLKRLVFFRIEIVRGGHAASHPEHDDRIGPRRRMHNFAAGGAAFGPRLREPEGGRCRCRQAPHKVAARRGPAEGIGVACVVEHRDLLPEGISANQLEFGQHADGPQAIGHRLRCGGGSENLFCRRRFGGGRAAG